MRIIKFLLPLAVLNLIALILVTFGLPNTVPMQMNLEGAVNSFGSKWFIPIFGIIPILIVIIYIIYIYYGNNDLNKNIKDKIIPAIAILFMIISWVQIGFVLVLTEFNSFISNYSLLIEITSFIFIVLSVLFVFIGYYIEDIKPNRTFGIRTPWTLNNEIVWKKTHKLGSYTFMIAGFVLLVYSLATFISENIIYAIIGLIISIFLAAIVPIIYSYYEYKNITN
ncbi:SdpI family protein [Methanobrevibacter sp. TMH8]|uniref:SdpI family protein n=1 Tax=Methanobrevibacter sp. TMH8 TaxID=2848611 RepID=UPI001CC9221F|nr:SdpI family protein [Methanobrevibacter sp. TMH8]MBZ9569943.1 SdpI family protein [Methanobrevibacter sp. TMH8]